jgi:hypothetical protein
MDKQGPNAGQLACLAVGVFLVAVLNLFGAIDTNGIFRAGLYYGIGAGGGLIIYELIQRIRSYLARTNIEN